MAAAYSFLRTRPAAAAQQLADSKAAGLATLSSISGSSPGGGGADAGSSYGGGHGGGYGSGYSSGDGGGDGGGPSGSILAGPPRPSAGELLARQADAADDDEMPSQFLCSISHEARTQSHLSSLWSACAARAPPCLS